MMNGKKKQIITIVVVFVFMMLVMVFIRIPHQKKPIGIMATENYILFEPMFDDSMTNSMTKAFEKWGELEYLDAEKEFKNIETELKNNKSHDVDEAFIQVTLGCLYLDMARYVDSYEYLIGAYTSLLNYYGEGDTFTLLADVELCKYYYTTGKYEDCLKEIQRIEEVLAANQEKIEEKYSVLIKCSLNMIKANLLADQVKEEYLDICVETKNMLDDSLDRELLPQSVAMQLFVTNRITLAELIWRADSASREATEIGIQYCDQAIEVEDCFDDKLSEFIITQINIEKAYNSAKLGGDNIEKASKQIKETIEKQENIFDDGKIYAGLSESYRVYAEMLGFIEYDLTGAEEYYQKALDVAKEKYGDNHPETAKIYESMGRFYGNRMNDVDKAILYFKKSLEIYKNLLVENHMSSAGVCLQLAGCYKMCGDIDESDRYLEKAYEMYNKLGVKILQSDGSWK